MSGCQQHSTARVPAYLFGLVVCILGCQARAAERWGMGGTSFLVQNGGALASSPYTSDPMEVGGPQEGSPDDLGGMAPSLWLADRRPPAAPMPPPGWLCYQNTGPQQGSMGLAPACTFVPVQLRWS